MPLGPDVSQSGQAKIYTKQQPDGVSINGNVVTTEQIADVGSLTQQYGLASLNGQVLPGKVGFTIAAGAANHSTITIQVQDNGGQAITQTDGLTTTAPKVWDLDIILALSTGVLTTLTPSTGMSVTTGTLLNTYAPTANRALYAQTDVTGKVVIDLLDTGKQGFFVMVQAGGQPVPALSRQLTAGDYG